MWKEVHGDVHLIKMLIGLPFQIYQIYGKRKVEDVYEILKKYNTGYIILEDSICLAPSQDGCRLPDLIDVDNGMVRFSSLNIHTANPVS